jgi:hypothetical protein
MSVSSSTGSERGEYGVSCGYTRRSAGHRALSRIATSRSGSFRTGWPGRTFPERRGRRPSTGWCGQAPSTTDDSREVAPSCSHGAGRATSSSGTTSSRAASEPSPSRLRWPRSTPSLFAPSASSPHAGGGQERPAISRARASPKTRSRPPVTNPLQRMPLPLYDEWATPDIFACTRAVSERFST